MKWDTLTKNSLKEDRSYQKKIERRSFLTHKFQYFIVLKPYYEAFIPAYNKNEY